MCEQNRLKIPVVELELFRFSNSDMAVDKSKQKNKSFDNPLLTIL